MTPLALIFQELRRCLSGNSPSSRFYCDQLNTTPTDPAAALKLALDVSLYMLRDPKLVVVAELACHEIHNTAQLSVFGGRSKLKECLKNKPVVVQDEEDREALVLLGEIPRWDKFVDNCSS